ncbi:MAG: protein phosphatase 2C domain-containing protein [Anaerolineae bacterium]|nr:protein phosphatase 2C domain-containing protein [Anaerolineae bacterium]
MNILALVDSSGWPTPLDPDMVTAMLESRLPPTFPQGIESRVLTDRWYETLPRAETVLFLFLTRPLTDGWQDVVKAWLGPTHRLYLMHTDAADGRDLRLLAQLTEPQPVPRAPYRIVQLNATGLDRAAEWAGGVLRKLDIEVEPEPPPVKITPTRWRNLPSNRNDAFAYPDQLTSAIAGAGGYALTAASIRGKSHAHAGTFRDDATAVTATQYWNIMAVGDGAGTAPLARVGSNLAVNGAITAMRAAMPALPSAEDVGKAIHAGLRGAYDAIRTFAKDRSIDMNNLHTTLQLLIQWPQNRGCILGLAHVGDGIIAAETTDRKYYLLTEPDTDPEDSGRTLFLTSGSLRRWMEERTHVYQFDEPLDIVALMTDGISSDLEPYDDLLHNNLFEALRQRVLCYPLKQREQALLAFISYERRGSFDDRTLAVLARE